jgi:PPK2 family polyphosphate:nucleotide phosphotransferase
MKHRLDHNALLIPPGERPRLAQRATDYSADFADKQAGRDALLDDVQSLAEAQELLYASDSHALLVILQAMDAAGKDGTIKHVMSGVNPQGCEVHSFKAPTPDELDHTYLWRCITRLPARGHIGIFNRSYYEEVLVVRVHPQYLNAQRLPDRAAGGKLWRQRYDEINDFERHLVRNGTRVVKFFLHVSKNEQRRRLLERLDDPAKNWKFCPRDVQERRHWDEYIDAYEEMIEATTTKWAPWYVIPADKKWFARSAVADVLVASIESLNLELPKPDAARQAELDGARRMLEEEP